MELLLLAFIVRDYSGDIYRNYILFLTSLLISFPHSKSLYYWARVYFLSDWCTDILPQQITVLLGKKTTFSLESHLLIWLHTKSLYYEAGDFAKKKNPQISLLKIMHPEILVVLDIHGHVYKNIHWI